MVTEIQHPPEVLFKVFDADPSDVEAFPSSEAIPTVWPTGFSTTLSFETTSISTATTTYASQVVPFSEVPGITEPAPMEATTFSTTTVALVK